MFIRRTQTRATAAGATYFTHRLVRAERCGDKVRQRTLLNLGRHFEVSRNDWTVLCQRIEEVLSGQMRLLPDCPPVLETHAQRIATQLLARHAAPSGAATPPPPPPRNRTFRRSMWPPWNSSARARSGSNTWDCGPWTSSGCARVCTNWA